MKKGETIRLYVTVKAMEDCSIKQLVKACRQDFSGYIFLDKDTNLEPSLLVKSVKYGD